jgi:hypothetical protein
MRIKKLKMVKSFLVGTFVFELVGIAICFGIARRPIPQSSPPREKIGKFECLYDPTPNRSVRDVPSRKRRERKHTQVVKMAQ